MLQNTGARLCRPAARNEGGRAHRRPSRRQSAQSAERRDGRRRQHRYARAGVWYPAALITRDETDQDQSVIASPLDVLVSSSTSDAKLHTQPVTYTVQQRVIR